MNLYNFIGVYTQKKKIEKTNFLKHVPKSRNWKKKKYIYIYIYQWNKIRWINREKKKSNFLKLKIYYQSTFDFPIL